MIEQKLQSAAQALPQPRGDYLDVEERVKKKQRKPKSTPRKRLIVAMVLAVLLVGCMSVTVPEYHLYNGNWWQFIPGLHFDPADVFDTHGKQTHETAKDLGITLPETLGEYPIIEFNRFNLTTKAVPLWYAWINPHYLYFSTYYGVEIEESFINDQGNESTLHRKEGVELIYGSTENDIWRRQFGYDTQNVFDAGNSILSGHQVEEITALEYEGFTVYTGKISIWYSGDTWWNVTWVDETNGVVFSLDCVFDTPDVLIEYAKEIIDLNR